MQPKYKYHIFLAHPSTDKALAKKLYHLLAQKYQVFLDSETLIPGDRWNEEIPKAQRESWITVVLVYQGFDRAYFLKEEILAAIELSRSENNRHRVMPVYLGYIEIPKEVPYGLRQLHAIFVRKKGSIKEAVQKIQKAVKRIETEEKKPDPSRKKNIEMERRVLTVENKISSIISEIRPRNVPVSVVFGDIDNFSQINNKYGIEVGDSIIQIIGEFFNRMPAKRYSGRIAGDEFVACLVGLNKTQVQVAAGNLVKKIQLYPWRRIAPELYVTISIGITKRERDDPVQRLLLRAIHGSVLAKRLGGNRVEMEVYIPSLRKDPETEHQEIMKSLGDYVHG